MPPDEPMIVSGVVPLVAGCLVDRVCVADGIGQRVGGILLTAGLMRRLRRPFAALVTPTVQSRCLAMMAGGFDVGDVRFGRLQPCHVSARG